MAVVISYAIGMVIFLGWLIGTRHLEWWCDHGFIYRFQTLISGFLAIVAAAIGALFLWLQIKTSERQESNRLNRRFAAARAELPMTLDLIVRYTEGVGGELRRLLDMTATGAPLPTGMPVAFPTISEKVLPHLRDLIETGDDAATNAFSGIIGAIQVHAARLDGIVEEVNDPIKIGPVRAEILARIIDNADVDAHATAMFPFARRKANTIPQRRFDESEIHSSVRRTLACYDAIEGLDTLVANRAARHAAQQSS